MQVIIPENEAHWQDLRKKCLTSTDVSALFNLSPYSTYNELWYRKKGMLDVQFEETSRMLWGKRLESAIATGIAEDLGLAIRPMKEFCFDEKTRLGSSFDLGFDPRGILEIKNVDSLQFKEKWEIDDDGGLEAPPYIEIQGQHQLMVSERDDLRIGALVGGNEVKIIQRAPDLAIHKAINAKAEEFWASIDASEPPPFDYDRDAELICKLHGFAEPGKMLDFKNNEEFRSLAFDHKIVSDQIKALEDRKESLKAHMLHMVGDCEKVLCGDFSVSAGVVGPVEMAFTRSGYRLFRINWPRGKKK